MLKYIFIASIILYTCQLKAQALPINAFDTYAVLYKKDVKTLKYTKYIKKKKYREHLGKLLNTTPIYKVSHFVLDKRCLHETYKFAEFYTDTIHQYRLELYFAYNQEPNHYKLVRFDNKGMPVSINSYYFLVHHYFMRDASFESFNIQKEKSKNTLNLDTILYKLPPTMQQAIKILSSKEKGNHETTTFYYENNNNNLPNLITTYPIEKSIVETDTGTIYHQTTDTNYYYNINNQDKLAYLYINGKIDRVYELMGGPVSLKRQFIFNEKDRLFEIFNFDENQDIESFLSQAQNNEHIIDFASSLTSYIFVVQGKFK